MEVLRTLKEYLILAELLAGLMGLYYCQSQTKTHWRYFAIYLIIIAVLETIGRNLPKEHRLLYYTYIAIPYQFLFIFWLFYQNFTSKRKYIIAGTIIYLVALSVEIWLDSAIFLSLSYSIGNIVMLVFIVFYFYELVFSERILAFHQEQMFWVALGLFLFYLGSFPYYGMYNYLKASHLNLMQNYSWVVTVLDYVMYFLFAMSFRWSKTN